MGGSRTELGQSTASGLIWAATSTVAGRIVSLVALTILARLLAPRDFGLLAFALVFITYVETLGDLGTGAALIYWPRRRDEAAQLTFLVNLAMGGFWFVVTWLGAPMIASFFQNPSGVGVLRAMAWVFPLRYLGNTHDALLQKELRFKARTLPEVGLAVAKLAVSVVLALLGYGVWSLVWGQLAGQAVSTAVMWLVVPWRPSLRLPGELLAPMLRYGRGMVAVNVLAAIVHHADLVVVGRMLGASALGLYQVATKVPEMTVTMLVWVVGRVLFPAFSKISAEGKDLGSAYLAALRYVAVLTLPAAIGLMLLAGPAIAILFGPKWVAAVPILQGLAAYAGIRSLGSHAGDVLKGTGRTGLLAALGCVKAALLVPALVWAGTIDAATVAWTLAAITVVTATINVAVVGRLTSISIRGIGAALAPGVVGAGTMAASLYGLGRWIPVADHPLRFAAAVVVGALVHLGTVAVVAPDVYRSAWSDATGAEDGGEEGIDDERVAIVDRFLVPLDRDGLFGYFVDRLHVAHTLGERLLRRLHGAVPGSLARRLLVEETARVPRGATGLPSKLVMGDDRGPQADPELVAEVLREAGLLGGDGAAASLRWIAVRGYGGEATSGELVLYLFEGSGSVEPVAVIKVRSGAGSAGRRSRGLETEWQALRWCHDRLSEGLASTVPKPLAYRRVVGKGRFDEDAGGPDSPGKELELLVQSQMPGRSAYVELYSDLSPGRHAGRHLEEAARWLARFHGETRVSGRGLDPAEVLESATRQRADETRAASIRLPDETVDRLRSGPSIPLVASHGDFWARNLLLGPEGTAVVDWECFAAETSSLDDLFRFPLTYGMQFPWRGYRRLGAREAFRRTFLVDGPVARHVGRYFRRYCRDTGMDRSWLEPLLHLYLLERAAADSEPGIAAGHVEKKDVPWNELSRALAESERSVFSN